jgi:hypothetical protein
MRQDFLSAVFGVYEVTRRERQQSQLPLYGSLPSALRQLMVQLASMHGDVFADAEQRSAYASFIVQGTVRLLREPCE